MADVRQHGDRAVSVVTGKIDRVGQSTEQRSAERSAGSIEPSGGQPGGPSSGPTADRPGPIARPWPIVLAAAFGAAVAPIQQTAVLPLLPRLQSELGASVTAVSWTFTISMLVGAVATPLSSRFGDMYGRRRMLLFSLAALVVGSVVSGLAVSLPMLLAGRVIQALSMALVPIAIGIARDVLPPRQMSTGIGMISATMGIGSGVGLVLAGVVAQYTTGFSAVFWVMTGLAVVAWLTAAVFVQDARRPVGGRADLPGALLLSATLVSLLLAITQGSSWGWTSGRVLGLFGAALVFGVVWVIVERRTPEPLVDIGMLTHPGTIGASVSGLLLGFAMFGGFTMLPQFVQTPAAVGYGFGATVLEAGLFLLPTSVIMVIVSPLAGGLIRRFPAAFMVAAGAAGTAVAGGWLVFSHGHPADAYIATSLLGFGISLAYAAMATMAVEHVPPEKTGVASGVNALLRLLGGSVAGAVTAAILASHTAGPNGLPTVQGYQWGFGVTALGAVVAALFALWFGLTRRRRTAG